MSEPTPEQQAAICAELARAQGWTVRADVNPDDSDDVIFELIKPDGRLNSSHITEENAWQYAPDPFTDAAASRALLLWLRTQSGEVQDSFAFKLATKTDAADAFAKCSGAYYGDEVLALMTAPLAVIAMAAHSAIAEAK